MKASQEREHFSQRLQHALRTAEYSPDSPTQLAREFIRMLVRIERPK